MKKDCNFNYAAMLISWNEKIRFTEIYFLNDAHPDLRKSFEYITKFKFTPSMHLDGRPILLIGSVDQRNTANCLNLYPYKESPSKVTDETMEILRKQLAVNSRTILAGVLIVVLLLLQYVNLCGVNNAKYVCRQFLLVKE